MSKREAIIQSAIQLFQEKGIEHTKISDIVKRANIAQGTFYLYFPSKLDLMPAIAEVMVKILMEHIKAKVSASQPFDQQLINIIDSIFSVNKKYQEIHAMIYTGLAATEHLKEWETVYAPCYELISDILTNAQEKGVINLSIKPERMAKLLIGLVESAAEQVYLYNHSDLDEIEHQRQAVLQFVFSALGVKQIS